MFKNHILDYEADHYCPVYEKTICADLCYDSLMCLSRYFNSQLRTGICLAADR